MLEDAHRPDHLQSKPTDLPPSKLSQENVAFLIRQDRLLQRWAQRYQAEIVPENEEASADSIMARILGDPDEAKFILNEVNQAMGIPYEEEIGLLNYRDVIHSADEIRQVIEVMVRKVAQTSQK